MKTLKKICFDFLYVYLISDFSRHQETPITEQVEKALQGGIRALQLREKDLSPKELLAQAIEIKPVIKKYGAKLFINDRADIAEIAGARKEQFDSKQGESLFSLIDEPGLYGVEFQGKRFDCGSKLGFIEANLNFGLNDPEIKSNLRLLMKKL